MPAERFTHKATTPKLKREWMHVYESAKRRGASPGSAVRQANGVIKKQSRKGKRSRSRMRARR